MTQLTPLPPPLSYAPNSVWKFEIIRRLDFPAQLALARSAKCFRELVIKFFKEMCEKNCGSKELPKGKTWSRLYGEISGLTLFWAAKLGTLKCIKTKKRLGPVIHLQTVDRCLFVQTVEHYSTFVDEKQYIAINKWEGGELKLFADKSHFFPDHLTPFEVVGNKAAFKSEEGVEIWDLKTEKKSGDLEKGGEEIVVCFKTWDNQIITGSDRGKVKVWDLNGAPLWEMSAHDEPIQSMRVCRDLLLTSTPHAVKIFSLPNRKVIKDIQITEEVVIQCMEVMDNKLFTANRRSTRIFEICWNRASLKETFTFSIPKNGAVPKKKFRGHLEGITCLQATHSALISGSDDRSIKIWDPETGNCLKTLDEHEGSILSLAIWEDTLISGSADKRVKVWGAKPLSKPEGKCEIF